MNEVLQGRDGKEDGAGGLRTRFGLGISAGASSGAVSEVVRTKIRLACPEKEGGRGRGDGLQTTVLRALAMKESRGMGLWLTGHELQEVSFFFC